MWLTSYSPYNPVPHTQKAPNRARQVAIGSQPAKPGSIPPYSLGLVFITGQLQRIWTCQFAVIGKAEFG